jgi:hypothetical protein
VGADKAYDVGDFVGLMRELHTTPHVTQHLTRPGGSAIDARTTRHAGYAMSQHGRADEHFIKHTLLDRAPLFL